MILWLALGVGAYFGGCFAIARRLVEMPRHVSVARKEFAIWEPVPGVRAWVTPLLVEGPRKEVFVFSHGMKGNRDYWADTALKLQERGYQVVILPMPGQDDNPEKSLGFGPKEEQLIRKTVRALKAESVVLVGCSLGGAASWMASDEPGVSGVVTDSAFAHLEPATRGWLRKDLPFGDILLRPVIWFGTAMVGIKPDEINPVDTAGRWIIPSAGVLEPGAPPVPELRRPALVIHGGEDRMIGTDQAEELAKASGAELWIIPGRGHADLQMHQDYVDRVEAVMKKTRSLR